MKRILLIFFLATIFFSQVGYYCISIIRQHLAKEAMEQQILAGIPEERLTIIDATAQAGNIIWEEKNKEFLLDGKLYDVAKTKIINGRTYLYCIGDDKEARVLKDNSNAVRSATGQHSTNNSTIHSHNFYPGDWTNESAASVDLSLLVASKTYSNFNVPINSAFKKINTPPPKIYPSQNLSL